MAHVAENLDAHARWVGEGTGAAEAEQAALLRLAGEYREIAAAATRAASTMRGLRELAPAPHDPACWDRAAFAIWMRAKIEMQRTFAQLLLEHAEESEQVLASEG